MSDDLHHVILIWPHKDAKEVLIQGEWDDWGTHVPMTKTSTGFETEVQVPWGKATEYKFLVDGEWKLSDLLESKTDYDPSGKYLNNTYTAPPKPVKAGGAGTKGNATRVQVRDAPLAPPKPLAPASNKLLALDYHIANATYKPLPYSTTGYHTMKSFYPYYLGEHSNPICRRLHLVGTTISVATFLRVGLSLLPAILPYNSYLTPFKLATPRWKLLLAGVVQAYMFAWVGHFFYEKNRPATFKHPFYSLIGDFKMWWEVVSLQRRW